MFRGGRRFEYKGQRDHAGIVKYMKEQAKLPSREVQTAREAQNNFARTEANVIAYFAEKNDMFDEYIGAANELRGKVQHILLMWCSCCLNFMPAATLDSIIYHYL